MSFHVGSLGVITGKRVTSVKEETVAAVDVPTVHQMLISFDDGSSLSIDLLSMSAMSYNDGKIAAKRRKVSKRRSR